MKKVILLASVLLAAAFVLTACAGPSGPEGPAGPAGPAGPTGPAGTNPTAADLTCTECHNNTTLLDGKIYAWEGSKHGPAGLAWEEEAGNKTCAGCHEGSSFIDRISAGQSFADYTTAVKDLVLPDATPQTCRTCHTIHTTYTKDDLALRTVAPVAMVVSGQTFDKGMGNLCVNCHQARRYMANFPAKDAAGTAIPGSYAATSRFNPHLSNQSDMMLGVGGGGTVTGTPSAHYTMTTDSCVTCHLGESANHTFDATVSACVTCHADAENTDVDGAVTAIQAKYDALETALIDAGLLKKTLFDGVMVLTELPEGTWAYQNTTDTYYEVSTVAGTYEEAKAFPLWVYGYIMEDGSMGVHNPKYANDLIDAALAGLGK